MNLKRIYSKVQDSAADYIDNVSQLAYNGFMVIDRPLDVPYPQFAAECKEYIEEYWKAHPFFPPLNLQMSNLGDRVSIRNHGNMTSK